MKNEKLIEIANHLEKLGKGEIEPENKRDGVCGEVDVVFDVSLFKIVSFNLWDEYSGDLYFPVAGDNEFMHAAGSLWSGSSQHKKRRRFCLWCAQQIREGIES